ncbi:MAG: IclR family transcriptional regulator [Eubacteriales bacterium]|nr:IclR family transcriptional regulator [Eubacteriales bacterium]
MRKKAEAEVKVKSLQKALEILGCFVEKQPLGVSEISEKLGLYKSNVHSILMTFKAMDYLEQDPETGKFRLGTAVFGLSRALRESLDITKIAIPYMKEIAEEAGELVYLTIPRGDEVVYLETVYPEEKTLGGRSVTGERSKMYCTSVGKAILAKMKDEEIEELLDGELESFTEYTITDKEKLWEEIRKTRERGYGVDNMELMFGIKCVGIALMNHKGQVEAGLSVSAPSLRMDEEKIEYIANILKRYACEIQKRL